MASKARKALATESNSGGSTGAAAGAAPETARTYELTDAQIAQIHPAIVRLSRIRNEVQSQFTAAQSFVQDLDRRFVELCEANQNLDPRYHTIDDMGMVLIKRASNAPHWWHALFTPQVAAGGRV